VNGAAPQLRLARPSRDLEAATRFYTEGLGLQVLGSFQDHDGFDGVILGHPAWPYHLELTQNRLHPAAVAPSKEDLLVFYIPNLPDWNEVVQRLRAAGAGETTNANPFWRAHGATFKDPDGYGVVLQNGSFTP
jgi:catechol 2,3-dioxygenase-like lactoylglutathione lyase family enzyme